MAGLRLDHVVIRVDDLAIGIADYTELGFTVVPGGEHKGRGSHNALIAFADDSYLELIAFHARPDLPPRPIARNVRSRELLAGGSSPVDWRMGPWETAAEGLIDFALVPDDIHEVLARAHANGLTLHGPFPGGRLRPDGRQVTWQLAIPDGCDLPFLCADVTERSLRVPAGAARQHANGATGIRGLNIVTDNLHASISRYQALLGTDPDPECRGFRLGGSTITLDSVGQNEQQSEGPNTLCLHGSQPSAAQLNLARAHGAVIFQSSDRE